MFLISLSVLSRLGPGELAESLCDRYGHHRPLQSQPPVPFYSLIERTFRVVMSPLFVPPSRAALSPPRVISSSAMLAKASLTRTHGQSQSICVHRR